jgi:CubicO group peptidase (beta-lactamase class C family)
MAHPKLRTVAAVAVTLAVAVLAAGSVPAAATVEPDGSTSVVAAPARAVGSAPSAAVVAKAVDDYLSDLVRRNQFRGAVLVARGDDVLFSKGYGFADESTGAVNTPHTRFRIGSVTKQFTAVAILKLQELGRLAVTDRVCRHVTPCPAAWESITIEHLLTHTSGIRNYTSFGNFHALKATTMSPEQVIGLFRDKTTVFPAGTRWQYSNSGYVLLGYIIERVTGGTYADFLHREILAPLGLSETSYDVDRASPRAHATGYWGWDERAADHIDMSVPYAAGAMYSSATDLYRWNRYLFTRTLPIVSADTLSQMLTGRVVMDPTQPLESSTYGYGLEFAAAPYEGWCMHGGGIEGFRAFNGFDPEQRLSITVLSNMEITDMGPIAVELVAVVAP